jgi:hypothetical protein
MCHPSEFVGVRGAGAVQRGSQQHAKSGAAERQPHNPVVGSPCSRRRGQQGGSPKGDEIGTAYVSLGDADTAVKWFRKGVEDRADCMAWLGVEPWIEPFRSDPRYAQLLRDVGLAPSAKTQPRP